MLGRNAPIYKSIAAAATTQVISRPGNLIALIFNTPIAASTIKLIDGTSGSTANMGTITNTTDVKPYVLFYGMHFTLGLRIITSGNDDVTVVYE